MLFIFKKVVAKNFIIDFGVWGGTFLNKLKQFYLHEFLDFLNFKKLKHQDKIVLMLHVTWKDAVYRKVFVITFFIRNFMCVRYFLIYI